MKDTREHIVEVSFDLFLRKNFKEVTVKEIVQKAGVSQGAFFHYFKTKEQLFFEIIDNAFQTSTGLYHSKLRKDSLYNFYHDYIDHFLAGLFPRNTSDDEGNFSINYFSLIFDALKLFPDFRDKMLEAQRVELKSWKEIIATAKTKGEIKPSADEEQLANMFITSSDGLGIRSILSKTHSQEMRTAMLSLWDGFYDLIKA